MVFLLSDFPVWRDSLIFHNGSCKIPPPDIMSGYHFAKTALGCKGSLQQMSLQPPHMSYKGRELRKRHHGHSLRCLLAYGNNCTS